MRSDYAARVLTILPEEFAIDVLNRMLRMETVQKEALRHIEETLRTEFVTTVAQTTRRDAHAYARTKRVCGRTRGACGEGFLRRLADMGSEHAAGPIRC